MLERRVAELSLLSFVKGSPLDKQKFIDDFYRGIVDYGFIILTDHIVDQALVDKAYELSHQLFSLSDIEKENFTCSEKGNQRGYTPFGKERAVGCNASDLKEFWHVGRELACGHQFEKFYPANIWPSQIKEFKETFLKLYQNLDQTSDVLLEALTYHLDLPNTFFKDMTRDGNSILRMIHYPPVKKEQVKTGSIRAAAHGDINLITLLVGARGSGLQLLDRDEKWLDVATRPGELVVDAGDMMSRLTNEVIPSTIHRVINPDSDNYDTHRYSMPFFVHPHPEASLNCLPSCVGSGAKFPDISAHTFLEQRLEQIGLM